MAQFTIIKPNTNIQFIAHRKPVMIGIFLLALVGFILTFVIGPNWGTSFEGGTSITMHFDQPVGAEEVRKLFVDDPRFESVSVQSIGTDEAKPRYVVRTRTTTTLKCADMDKIHETFTNSVVTKSGNVLTVGQWPACNPKIEDGIRGDFFVTLVPAAGQEAPETPMADEDVRALLMSAGLEAEVVYEASLNRYTVKPQGIQNDVVKLLNDTFGERFDEATGVDEIVTVGAEVGDKFRSDAIVSILMALGLMLLYIAIRFDSRYAPAAIISLAMSTLVAWGFVVVLGLEITLETVAAFLTLVGYGINDTIVNFDRIRENRKLIKGMSYREIVNLSINQTLARTILTSVTVALVLIMQLCFGGAAIRDFVFVMLIGVVVGTISTIFVSVIIIAYWHKNDKGIPEDSAKPEPKKA